MFRCCLPCRGGSTAPATSPPSSPESSDENYTNLYHSDSVRNEQPHGNNSVNNNSSAATSSSAPSSSSAATSTAAARTYHDTQTSPLPHIEEEEELDPGHQLPSDDCNSLKEHLINKKRSIRIVNQVQLQQHQQQQREKAAASLARRNSSSGGSSCGGGGGGAGTGSGAGGDENLSSSPSPRSKHNRKSKTRTKTPASSSSETATTTATTGNLLTTNLISAIANPSSGYLLPKMQAEQGSIGELQKYHSRYLKNRRHTLANVR